MFTDQLGKNKYEIGGGEKTGHVVLKYLFSSLLQKRVGAGGVTLSPYNHLLPQLIPGNFI
jgi:hypothetical protein